MKEDEDLGAILDDRSDRKILKKVEGDILEWGYKTERLIAKFENMEKIMKGLLDELIKRRTEGNI